jgi:translation initiation factor IF-2
MRNRPPPRRGGGNRRPPSRNNSRPPVAQREAAAAKEAAPRGPIELPAAMTVKELSDRLVVPAGTIIGKLLQSGNMKNINETIDYDTAAAVAADLGLEVLPASLETGGVVVDLVADRPEDLHERPPVITVMGHVDHGKTSLLDAIRNTRVTAGEAGGITQHIGAYQVDVNGKRVTFLDTPGHEAFTSMRARGAKATDIAVLVVAADDGVMATTREAADHARAAGVPILVAMNKIDRPDTNPDRLKQQLIEIGLVPEEYGGETVVVPVSARTGEGLDHLLEMILFLAEMGEFKANPNRPALGVVIEAKLDKARGPVCTVLVENGTLNVGDVVVVGGYSGRIKALFNDKGKRIKSVDPGSPAEILGLDGVPQAGDRFQAVSDEKTARALAQAGKRAADAQPGADRPVVMESILEGVRSGTVKDFNLIVKADVRGSLEALTASIQTLAEQEAIQREIRTKVVHADTGNVTESDVMLAAASKAIIVAFNVRIEPGARRAADAQGVEIRSYNVIYHLTEELERVLSGMLEPEYHEVILGEAEVRQVFKVSRAAAIAGSYVTSGTLTRNAQARIFRGGELIHEGRIEGLRRFKDDVREVQTGYECGIQVSNFTDFKEGDTIQAHSRELVS